MQFNAVQFSTVQCSAVLQSSAKCYKGLHYRPLDPRVKTWECLEKFKHLQCGTQNTVDCVGMEIVSVKSVTTAVELYNIECRVYSECTAG